MKTCRYLSTTGDDGIIMDPEEFVFCRKQREFVGFELSKHGVEPGREILKSIRE